MREREYKPDDAIFLVTSAPDLAVQLTCEPGRWRVMVFDLTEKKPALAGHYEDSLAAAKRFATEFVRMRYSLDLTSVEWKDASRRRGFDV